MKILLIADIHSNWPALASIDEAFDACLFMGDLVDYATDPVPCIDWVRTRASACVRGNHDHAVAQRISARSGTGLRRLAAATRPIHWDILNPQQIKYLARLPVTRRITIDEQVFYLVHGTPRDPMDEYLRENPSEWAQRLESIDADFVCVGHTHAPLCLDLGHLRVINPGSVGQPRDGDPRCAYAIIEKGRVEFRRVPYNIDETLDQMKSSGVGPEALDLAESVLRTGGQLGKHELSVTP